MNDFKDANQRRIYNLIWDMAEDYSIKPSFLGYDLSLNPSFYFNMIIGLSYKIFGKDNIEYLFDMWKNTKYQERYDNLTWIGLENYSYNFEKRPNLFYLRKDYAKDFFSDKNDLNRRNLSYRDIKVYLLTSKHMANILGRKFTSLTKNELELLNDLYKINNNESLKDQFKKIYEKYFDFENDIKIKNRRNHFFIKHFNYKSPHFFERSIKPSSLNIDFKGKKFKNPITFYKFKKREKKEEEIEEIFGKSIFDKKKLDLLEKQICTKEDKLEKLWYTKSRLEDIKNKESLDMINKARNLNKEKYLFKKSLYDLEIRNLSNKLKKLNNELFFDDYYITKSGRLNTRLSYRTIFNNEDVFERKDYKKRKMLSVDLLLDSSRSMFDIENDIAISAYILGKSLEISGIKFRIISYLSFDYYNVINILKDFDENLNMDRIFSYHACGFNRDSTAFKAYRNIDKKTKNRICLIMSDLNPSDLRPIYNKGIRRNTSYDGNKAIDLYKKEIRNLRLYGYKTSLLSFKNKNKDFIDNAKDIFFNDFAILDSASMLSSRASLLIEKNIKNFNRKNR